MSTPTIEDVHKMRVEAEETRQRSNQLFREAEAMLLEVYESGRKRRKVTGAALADSLGVHPQQVWKMLRRARERREVAS